MAQPTIEQSLEERLQLLEASIVEIQERNRRVELEKSWELSITRRVIILSLTYLIASAVLFLLDTPEFWLAAIIPTLGYFLSTLSVSFIKRVWMGLRG
jgi:hypothetical protein